jgi:hypothetical protein
LTKEKFKSGMQNLSDNTNPELRWDGYGTNFATYFHPHIYECFHPNKMSAVDFFNSDEDFTRGIKKIVSLYGKDKITESKVREICRNEKASSRINNFPPRVAIKILNHLDLNNVTWLDPCHGFSGRLIGAYASKRVDKYIGVDLSPETHEGALETKKWLEDLDGEMKIDIIHGDCLEEMGDKKADLIMTSPPFLDVEVYKGVPYDTDYQNWMSSFIEPFIKKSYRSLEDNGYFVLYLEKIRRHDFVSDFSDICKQEGFNRLSDIEFAMSYGENNRGDKSSRCVSILVFRK